MIVTPVKTDIVTPESTSIPALLDRHLSGFPDRSILAISSKIISLCEGRTAALTEDREELITREANYYLPIEHRHARFSGAITHHAFIGAAGIDESNAAGHYVLLPKDSWVTAVSIHRYLIERFGVRDAGVIVTDSHSTPLRRGASGISIAYHGFDALRDYRGTPDLFDRPLRMEQANIADALAAAAVLVMGEGSECTPIAVITDLPTINFNKNAPTDEDRAKFLVDPENDIFSPLFDFSRLRKGGSLEKKP
ncbi:MAG: putative folate metabolism gamma-glutamate ligase [Candidatus Moranbacteria bacterium]|nr:putative folate metabolism gamma-glutamate ligase [Candidatus Moranbacteria bacterium]